ncbi:MAG: glutamine-synthetase adenylyltransferase, partial [Magnetovibrio sp.]|nr:glutamine-synthetase adenylyltransferase [Magnetovibrio sp.]
MQLFHFDPQNLPAPADEDRIQTAWERFEEAAKKTTDSDPNGAHDLMPFIATLKSDPAGAKLAAAVFGNSPFLTACWLNDPLFTKDLLLLGPTAVRDQILSATHDGSQGLDEAQLKTHLRTQKKRIALTTAVADITGCWGLFEVTGALSDFADAAT